MTHVATRLAELEYLDAVRHEADETLQNLVDEVRGVFGAELCMVNLALADALYFKAWSGKLPQAAAEAGRASFENEMCSYVVQTEVPLVVHDFLATEEFEDHALFALRGIRFYAGTPLVTSRGVHIGTLCVMDARPREFGEEQMTLLGAFAGAVVERLELIGALGREQTARQEENQRSRELRHVLDASPDIIATIGWDGVFKSMNSACKAVLGYEPGEIVGRSYMDLIHPDDRSAGLGAALVDGKPRTGFENRCLRKDGGIVWIEWSATPVPEEGVIYCVARDVTGRKRAERSRSRSERRFRQLFEQSVDALLVHDQTGQMVDCNAEACCSLGYTREDLLALSIKDFATDLVSEEERERGGTLWQRVSAGEPGEVTGFHYGEHRRKDGTTFPVEVHVGRIDYGGEPMIFAAVHDITERKRMEAELRESEERYRNLAEHHPDAILVHSEGKIVYVNAAGVDLLGATGQEDLLGEPALDMIHPDYQDLARERVRRVQEEGSVAELVEEKIIRLDGRVFDAELVGLPFTYGGLPSVQVVIRDITERKRSEKALVERARHAALRADVSAAFAEGGDLERVLRRCTESMTQYLGAAFARVWTLDEEESVLKLRASSGMYTHLDGPHGRIPVGELKVGLIARERVAHLTNDVVNDPRVSDPEWARREGLVAFAGYPLVVEDRLVGVAAMFAREPLAEDTTEALASVSDVIAQGIERKRAEKTLCDREQRFRSLIQNASDIIFISDADRRISYLSPSVQQVLGYRPEELIGTSPLDYVHPEDIEKVQEAGARLRENPGTTSYVDFRLRRADGSWRYMEAIGNNLFDEPSVRGLVYNARDATERKRAEKAMRESEGRLVAAQRIAHLGNWEYVLDEDRAWWSDELYLIFGLAPREISLTYKIFLDLVHPEDRRFVRREARRGLFGRGQYDIEYRIVRPDGEVRSVHTHYEVIHDGASGKPVKLAGTIQDITARKALEDQLAYQATHDPLTDLPNRALLMDRLRQALARVNRRKKSSVAVLFLDLDNFKVVNDSLGHEAGDHLLVAVTERLEACLRPGDTAARLGGDEFTILLEEITHESEATSVAERIAEELRAPFVLGDYEVTITASIGVVLCGSSTGNQPEDLLRNADMAMYEAKSKGKDRHTMFTRSMHVRAVARLRLETELRRAIERGEFRLHYQPTLRVAGDLQQRLRSTGSQAIVASPDADRPLIVGMEALLRWEHPERGLVSPLEFIPIAEETGLIVPIGRWVIREACRQAREWQERYSGDPPLVMSVNFSAYQFRDPDLAQNIVLTLGECGLDPGSLILEITESVLMEEVKPTLEALEELRRVGVQIAIDDFGTGYSSLSYLKRFPVDYLKIDRSFIDGLEDHSENAVLVSGIVVLGHALGLQVVAEGVETAEQLARVREKGCDLAQGFLFSRPLPVEAAEALLEAESRQ